MSNIGYIRVSTVDQNEARQREALKNYNIDKFFIEKKSGKNTNRPKFKAMLEYARPGDTIFILDFSRICRSLVDLLRLVEELKARKIKLVSLKENLDTSTPNGKLMLAMIGAINEFERANLLERQKEGIEIAKKQGKYKGRKPIEKPKNWEKIFSMYLKKNISAIDAMRKLNLKKSVFYKFVRLENSSQTICPRPTKTFSEKFACI